MNKFISVFSVSLIFSLGLIFSFILIPNGKILITNIEKEKESITIVDNSLSENHSIDNTILILGNLFLDINCSQFNYFELNNFLYYTKSYMYYNKTTAYFTNIIYFNNNSYLEKCNTLYYYYYDDTGEYRFPDMVKTENDIVFNIFINDRVE